MAVLKTELLVTCHDDIKVGQGGMSIGDAINHRIRRALENGERLQSVEMFFEASDWEVMIKDFEADTGELYRPNPTTSEQAQRIYPVKPRRKVALPFKQRNCGAAFHDPEMPRPVDVDVCPHCGGSHINEAN